MPLGFVTGQEVKLGTHVSLANYGGAKNEHQLLMQKCQLAEACLLSQVTQEQASELRLRCIAALPARTSIGRQKLLKSAKMCNMSQA